MSTFLLFAEEGVSRYTACMSMYRMLRDADVQGKHVLLRAGFDVPMDNETVTDISRIEAIIPTMKYVLEHGGSLVIVAHQDRPKGKVVPEMSQRPIVPVIERLLGVPVQFAESCVGAETKRMVDALPPGGVILLENLRYDAREEEADEEFARELASFADVYVNDAFSVCHRDSASMVTVAKMLPAYAGLQLEAELTHLGAIRDNPAHPLTLIVSGAKIETKLPVIEFFRLRGDDILVGGAIANTFIGAAGNQVGISLCEPSFYPTAREMMKDTSGKARVHVPVDVVVAQSPTDTPQTVSADAVPEGFAMFDAGPQTVERYAQVIRNSACVVWNGPIGKYEEAPFAAASIAIADILRDAAKGGVTVIVGGGDTIDFHTVNNLSMNDYSFVSTGGGAMLDFVSGQPLPALEPLRV